MKGFGSRERNGLITFCIVVMVFLALGPIADRLGCTSRHDPPAPSEALLADSVKSDSGRDVAYADSAASPVRKNARGSKRKERGDSVRKPRRKKTSGTSRPPSRPEPQRRSYLDEPI